MNDAGYPFFKNTGCLLKMIIQCTKFYNELSFLKDIFFKNGYPASFIDKCFKTFLNKICLKGRQMLTLEKEHLP